jgi:hypothetical protein
MKNRSLRYLLLLRLVTPESLYLADEFASKKSRLCNVSSDALSIEDNIFFDKVGKKDSKIAHFGPVSKRR